ncbi:hypothetical protein TI39_contig340g00016 [Zymoseptoria brevis]|uniref:Uncharacterized protein n=1 Tax=Zymoseptoria brevis TaxID=1047168 RepID=A0A0F4GT02_9PEZI|nr:hypothetical protein TI39_contig340g00016 [Zymoseptoria brevis]
MHSPTQSPPVILNISSTGILDSALTTSFGSLFQGSAAEKPAHMVLHQINAQFQCSLLRLPLELRNQIYGHFLTNIESSPVHLGRHFWAPRKDPSRRSYYRIHNYLVSINRTPPNPAGDGTDDYHNLLVTCGRTYEEMSDHIYRKHELNAYLDRIWDDTMPLSAGRRLIRDVDQFANLFERVHRLSLTIFVTGDNVKDTVVVGG